MVECTFYINKDDDKFSRIIKNFFKLINTRTIMKTIIKGMVLLLAGASFVACSKDVSFDENAQKQAEQEAQIAQKYATYQSDFVKAFGSIASGHKWGFDRTGGATRTAVTSTSEIWIVPDNFTAGRKEKEGDLANHVQAAFNTNLPTELSGFNFKNYWLQHTDMPKNVKVSIDCLEAYNSDTKKWERVTNFEAGKNTDDFEIEESYINADYLNSHVGLNRSAACATLMKEMGGEPYQNENDANDPANGKRFRVKYTNNTYNYSYYFLEDYYYKKNKKEISGDFIGFYFDATVSNNGKTSFWVIKIGEAQRDPSSIVKEGRVFCEDMGANDFDFNDVVFDAWIMGNGEIKIKILAHGGMLPIKVAGRDVTLPQMSNTGEAEAEYQEFTIPAKSSNVPEWANIEDIPVQVVPNNDAQNIYELKATVGSAPQKICAPVNTEWPDEYIRINQAYSPFTTWVSISDPEDWTFRVNPILVDGILSNNKQ